MLLFIKQAIISNFPINATISSHCSPVEGPPHQAGGRTCPSIPSAWPRLRSGMPAAGTSSPHTPDDAEPGGYKV